MGLIKCPECGKEISDKAQSCPNCGCPLQEATNNDIKRGVENYGTWDNAQNKKPKQKTHGCLIAFLVTILAILLFGVLIAIGATIAEKKADKVSNSNDSAKKEIESDTQIYAGTEAESGITVPNAIDEAEGQNESVCSIGDAVSLKDWAIVVTDFKIVDTIDDDYGYFSPDSDGDKYAQVFVTATNNGKQSMTFLPYCGFGDDVDAKLLYDDNYEFSATDLIGYSNEIHDAVINPLSSQSGEIAFEIPDSVASSTDEIIIQFTSGNDKVQFKVR